MLPLESDAEQMTFARPSLKKLPEHGVQATGSMPSTASTAERRERRGHHFERVVADLVGNAAPAVEELP